MTRYPFTDVGNLQFYAAGEHQVQQQAGKGEMVVAYGVRLRFIGEISRWMTQIDTMLEPTLDDVQLAEGSALLRQAQPAVANGVLLLLGVSLLAFPLLALLPLTLPWVVLSLRCRHYRIETGRVVSLSGILFKKQETVLWSRIDALQKRQGFLNTVLSNGSIFILTAGTSTPDLKLLILEFYDVFHADLRRRYAARDASWTE